ncbi:MAG: hypothetical protein ACOY94_07400 [Bacillota bacterium]
MLLRGGKYDLVILRTIDRQYRAMILEDRSPLIYQDEVNLSGAIRTGINMLAVLTRLPREELCERIGLPPSLCHSVL